MKRYQVTTTIRALYEVPDTLAGFEVPAYIATATPVTTVAVAEPIEEWPRKEVEA